MAVERDEPWWSCDDGYGLEMKRVAVFDFSSVSGDGKNKKRRWVAALLFSRVGR